MNARHLRISPTTAAFLAAGAALVVLLWRGLVTSNSERTVAPAPIALVAPSPAPPPAETKKPETTPQHETVQPLDVNEWMPGTNPSPGSTAPGPGSTAPGGPLGLNESGGAGADAFGLAGRPGGRELLAGGGGGAGGSPGARFAYFANALGSHVREQLTRLESLRRSCYVVELDVWVAPSGLIRRTQLRSSSGDRALDAKIEAAFEDLAPMTTVPPADMPWPVRLRVRSQRPDCPLSQ